MKHGNVWNRLEQLEQVERQQQSTAVFYVPLTEDSDAATEAECRRRFEAYIQGSNRPADNVVFYLPDDPQHAAYVHGEHE